jgi:hypothetical protein
VKCEGNGSNLGCGIMSYYDQPFSASSCVSDHCKVCRNRLLSYGLNAAGHRLYLGQTVFFIRYVYHESYWSCFSQATYCVLTFHRNGSVALLEKGRIVHFWDSKGRSPGATSTEQTERKITVKYYDTAYKADRYDEIVSQSNVFVTAGDADVGKGKRTRHTAVPEAPPLKLIGNIRKSPINSTTTAQELAEVSISQSPLQSNKRAKKADLESKPRLVAEKSASPVADIKASRRSKISAVDPGTLDERFDNKGVHDLVAMLYPSYGDRTPFRNTRYLDRQIKRGLLHAVYHYVKPPTFGIVDTCASRAGPVITLAQLEELLEVCPTTRDEMADRSLMPLCAPLLRTPDCVGETLVEVVKNYLTGRGFDTAKLRDNKRKAGLGRKKERDTDSDDDILDGLTSTEASRDLPRGLSIPLSFEHFSLALDLAFEMLGGREAFENRKGVKGLEYVVNCT